MTVTRVVNGLYNPGVRDWSSKFKGEMVKSHKRTGWFVFQESIATRSGIFENGASGTIVVPMALRTHFGWPYVINP